MLTLKTLLIICPLVFLAGFVDAIAGGGGLISLPAYLLAGLPPHQAIATNKMSSTIGTCASTARYLKNGYVDWQAAIPCMVMAIRSSTSSTCCWARCRSLPLWYCGGSPSSRGSSRKALCPAAGS